MFGFIGFLFTVFLILAVLLVLFAIAGYNRLVALRQRCKNGWAQIENQLKRRHDLIPNLVETVKGYMRHEREVLENVVKARQQAIDVRGVQEAAQAENMLTQALRSLFALVENYPELRASENVRALQEELASTENKIAFARQFYNDQVMEYNTAIQQFPWSFFAAMFHFEPEEYFEVEDAAVREVPKVQF